MIKTPSPYVPNKIYYLLKSKKNPKIVYATFVKTKEIFDSNGIQKWREMFNLTKKRNVQHLANTI